MGTKYKLEDWGQFHCISPDLSAEFLEVLLGVMFELDVTLLSD